MKKSILKIAFVFLCLLSFTNPLCAQILDPVSWSYNVKPLEGNRYELRFVAEMDISWHIYDLGPYENGPTPTSFTFSPAGSQSLVGELVLLNPPKRTMDAVFKMNIGYCSDEAVFVQVVEVTAGAPTVFVAVVEWQACDDSSCLPPDEYTFKVELPAASGVASENASEVATQPVGTSVQSPSAPVSTRSNSLWAIILEAIIWGFVALLTPCVFPMVPMTVSFFLKGSENKTKGRFMASMYGIFIILLYTVPIAVIILATYFTGGEAVTADIFNWLATHWIPNVIFFLVFMIFAASFFGAFEITLPSWMVNKSDAKSDKGGLVGVFFMALTLVLVSFSCTGPIVGTVLIKSTQGEIWEPIVTMLAFSTAFALPFTIFAFAPSLLKELPKSGGWLNAVKVVLGFIEVALGLKFLSVADQTYHWGILDREVYLALWIVVFSLLGVYLLGKLKFAHDSDVKHISVPRLFLSIVVFSFVVYMVPGMWGAPLKALSGYMPPLSSQDFVMGSGSGTSHTATMKKTAKYSDFLHLPHGLEGFFEYKEALAYAKEVGKPLFVDFTGHGCVNCREMETRVWSNPQVLALLRDEYVVVALYADDKKQLPEEDWVTDENGRVYKSLGKINSYFARVRFGVNAQPYYALLGHDEQFLVPPRGYDLNVESFANFLIAGVEAFNKNK